MNKAIPLTLACVILIAALSPASFATSRRSDVPNVPFLSPEDESTIDLTGKPGITFEWKNSPVPGGGREAFRFKLIKGFKYDFIVSEELGQGVYSIVVPSEKFEDGVTYSWYVEQRDASLNTWSRHDTVWSFKVIKK
jgi:hypothetical protein